MRGMVKYAELTALKGLLKERKTTYQGAAEIIGKATRTFSNKINGYDSFDALEMDRIAEYFGINTAEVGRYFFP